MLVEAEVWTIARSEQGNAVLIRPIGSETAVPIFIGQLEAQSILIGLGNVPMPRPLTHDLIISIFEHNKVALLRVEITSLKEGTFFAQIVLSYPGHEEDIVIDSRPSDAIALAVRLKAPVFIDEGIVDEAGISVNVLAESEHGGNPTFEDAEREKLEQQLKQAIEIENYEEAARIRDRLSRLEEGA